jgi:hypothetical protein
MREQWITPTQPRGSTCPTKPRITLESTTVQVGTELEIQEDTSAAGTQGQLSRLCKLRTDRVVGLSYDGQYGHAV